MKTGLDFYYLWDFAASCAFDKSCPFVVMTNCDVNSFARKCSEWLVEMMLSRDV